MGDNNDSNIVDFSFYLKKKEQNGMEKSKSYESKLLEASFYLLSADQTERLEKEGYVLRVDKADVWGAYSKLMDDFEGIRIRGNTALNSYSTFPYVAYQVIATKKEKGFVYELDVKTYPLNVYKMNETDISFSWVVSLKDEWENHKDLILNITNAERENELYKRVIEEAFKNVFGTHRFDKGVEVSVDESNFTKELILSYKFTLHNLFYIDAESIFDIVWQIYKKHVEPKFNHLSKKLKDSLNT